MRRRITLCGSVQGVGFRPFVYREASGLGLGGWVLNSTAGVTIEAEGDPAGVAALLEAVQRSPPAHARIAQISVEEVAPLGETAFSIRGSEIAGVHSAEIPPDLATCPTCLGELFDPVNRRHRYPFINCTECGPRYSIVDSMPYDRARTSMRGFTMCRACQAEYEGPGDRRFHAEPNACPVCGPRLALLSRDGEVTARDDEALAAAVDAIRHGAIVAVKGIGGFHLMASALEENTVRLLRLSKRREEKPFAVMFPDLDSVRMECHIDAISEGLLSGRERPIVLLKRRPGSIASSVAPGNHRLGVLLPYSPLHHLLMADLGFPLVATSGNMAGEPIATDQAVARERLAGISELFLVHDRPIVRAIDDSVAQIVCDRPQVLRRARGYAPASLAQEGAADSILAFGGHLKAAVALTMSGRVAVSQHLGDLETRSARQGFQSALADLASLHGASPRIAVRALPPAYASSRVADSSGLPVIIVQHHVAHVAACLGEHGVYPPALGVAWDGTGLGTDGTVWGGEFIRVDRSGWRRVAAFRRFRLPGGDLASREPRRAALGLLYAAFGESVLAMTDLAPVAAFTPAERTVLAVALARGINAPLTSSVGRLFDAFAALAGLRQRTSHEGQAASELEAEIEAQPGTAHRPDGRYTFALREGDDGDPLIVDWQPALEAALADLRSGVRIATVSAALHAGLASAIVDVARRIGEPNVALTGGCFQNVHLTEAAVAALRSAGFRPLWHQQVPPNDGGIAFGQAIWAGWTQKFGATPCA